MQLLVCSLLVAMAIQESRAANWSEPVPIHPDYPRKCYDHANKKYYSVGNRWNRKGECSRYTCALDSTTTFVLLINGESCNYAHDFPSHCHLTVPNKNTAYPNCCPKVICKKPPVAPLQPLSSLSPLSLSSRPLSPQSPLSPRPLSPQSPLSPLEPVFAPPLEPVFALSRSIRRRNQGE